MAITNTMINKHVYSPVQQTLPYTQITKQDHVFLHALITLTLSNLEELVNISVKRLTLQIISPENVY